MQMPRIRSVQGFSPIELIVAVMIFSVGVLGTVGLLGAGYRYEGRAQLETQLTVLAEAKLEELRAVAGTELADTVALVPGGSLTTNQPDYQDTATLGSRQFVRRWEVVLGPAGVRQVTVRTAQLDPAGPEFVDLTTNLIHD